MATAEPNYDPAIATGLSLSGTVLTVGSPATAFAIPASTSLTSVALQVAGDPNTGVGPIGGADTISLVAGGIEALRCKIDANAVYAVVGGTAANSKPNAYCLLSTDSKTWFNGVSMFANGDDHYGISDSTNIRFAISLTGNIALGTVSAANTAPVLATNATAAFPLAPTCAGPPTGAAPDGSFTIDTTNNKWYFRSGATWRDAGP